MDGLTLFQHPNEYSLSWTESAVMVATGFSGIPYGLRHKQLSSQPETKHWMSHRIIMAVQFLPLAGGLAALFERIAAIVYRCFHPISQNNESVRHIEWNPQPLPTNQNQDRSISARNELINIATQAIEQKTDSLMKEALQKLTRNELIEIKLRFEKEMEEPTWNELKDSNRGKEIIYVIEALRKATVRFSQEALTSILLGNDLDKGMSKCLIETAGWGSPSAMEWCSGFEGAIKELNHVKAHNGPMGDQLNQVMGAAKQLLNHSPPIKALRDPDVDFLNRVINPLAELVKGTALFGAEADLQTSFYHPVFIDKKEIKQEFKQSGEVFKNQLKQIATGSISEEAKKTLLENLTKDFRAHIAALNSNIEPEELDNQAWNKSASDTTSPNVKAQIAFTQSVVTAIPELVLNNSSTDEMVRRKLEFFGELACDLRKDNNFDALIAVSGALNSIALKRLWELPSIVPVGDRFIKTMEDVKTLISRTRNYGALRQALKDSIIEFSEGKITSCPISYFGLLLTDLTYIQESNPSHLDEKINGDMNLQIQKQIESFQEQKMHLSIAGSKSERLTGFLDLISAQNISDREEAAIKKSKELFPLNPGLSEKITSYFRKVLA